MTRNLQAEKKEKPEKPVVLPPGDNMLIDLLTEEPPLYPAVRAPGEAVPVVGRLWSGAETSPRLYVPGFSPTNRTEKATILALFGF